MQGTAERTMEGTMEGATMRPRGWMAPEGAMQLAPSTGALLGSWALRNGTWLSRQLSTASPVAPL